MPDNFDDFAQRHSEDQQNLARLANETKPEWAVLKGLTSRFALDSKEFEGHRFEWVTHSPVSPDCLILDYVAAIFLDHGEKNGVPQGCRVLFTRKPLASNQVWAEDESRVAPQTWSLEPAIEGDSLVWSVRELGERLSSADLAEKIAIELAKYHKTYKAAYDNWTAA